MMLRARFNALVARSRGKGLVLFRSLSINHITYASTLCNFVKEENLDIMGISTADDVVAKIVFRFSGNSIEDDWLVVSGTRRLGEIQVRSSKGYL